MYGVVPCVLLCSVLACLETSTDQLCLSVLGTAVLTTLVLCLQAKLSGSLLAGSTAVARLLYNVERRGAEDPASDGVDWGESEVGDGRGLGDVCSEDGQREQGLLVWLDERSSRHDNDILASLMWQHRLLQVRASLKCHKLNTVAFFVLLSSERLS